MGLTYWMACSTFTKEESLGTEQSASLEVKTRSTMPCRISSSSYKFTSSCGPARGLGDFSTLILWLCPRCKVANVWYVCPRTPRRPPPYSSCLPFDRDIVLGCASGCLLKGQFLMLRTILEVIVKNIQPATSTRVHLDNKIDAQKKKLYWSQKIHDTFK